MLENTFINNQPGVANPMECKMADKNNNAITLFENIILEAPSISCLGYVLLYPE
jgi:hypothetical protein